jgi:xylan 1,4-beta-xylosidase
MGRPKQLTKQQVETIKSQNDGSPISKEKIKIGSSGVFSKDFDIRENDVLMVQLIKL